MKFISPTAAGPIGRAAAWSCDIAAWCRDAEVAPPRPRPRGAMSLSVCIVHMRTSSEQISSIAAAALPDDRIASAARVDAPLHRLAKSVHGESRVGVMSSNGDVSCPWPVATAIAPVGRQRRRGRWARREGRARRRHRRRQHATFGAAAAKGAAPIPCPTTPGPGMTLLLPR